MILRSSQAVRRGPVLHRQSNLAQKREYSRNPHPSRGSMRLLLLIPFIGLLWLPFYNMREPSLFGFPFFYWYQFAWVPATCLILWIVYRHERRTPRD
jgi:hypothetical protein